MLAVLVALSAAPALAQGCAMCYESAKHAGADGQRAINRAVLVLLVPTITLIGGMVGVTLHFKDRNQDRGE
jgi:hypothetical protein